MKQTDKTSSAKRWLFWGGIYAVLFFALILVINSVQVSKWISGLLRLFRPIIWGLIFAYLLNPFFRFYERKCLYKIQPKGLRRTLSLILTYLSALLIIGLLFLLIIPQLYSSISAFIANYDSYISAAVKQYNSVLENLNTLLSKIGIQQSLLDPLSPDVLKLSSIFVNFDKIMAWAQELLGNNAASSIINTLSNFVAAFVDGLFAFFISLYLLSTKEQRYAQIMKIRRALLSDKTNANLTRFCKIADSSFGGFIEGKLLDSLIIGILTYLVLLIFAIPYPELIATTIGVTNIIPFVGPIIGAIPTSIIILLTEPAKVIPFLIIVVVIQQIDGNIIGPKILGNNTGVSSLCVLIAITVMGSIWGFVGMLLGVPIFATVIELATADMNERLRNKGFSFTTENYYPSDSPVDPAQDVRSNTDKLIKKFERTILRLQKKQERQIKLSRYDRMRLSFYRFMRKWHIIGELSDENSIRFTVEEAVHAAEADVKQLIKEEHGTDLLD